jgi:hypothetical protein
MRLRLARLAPGILVAGLLTVARRPAPSPGSPALATPLRRGQDGWRLLRDHGVRRVTSGSMPPPTQFDGTFWGDYTGLSAVDTAFPAWSDTCDPALFLCPGTGVPGSPPAVCQRSASNAAVANDQEIYTAAVKVPSS